MPSSSAKRGATITVVTVGEEEAEKELRTALAMGCDKAVLINIEDDLEEADQYTASAILYNYLKDREYDMILQNGFVAPHRQSRPEFFFSFFLADCDNRNLTAVLLLQLKRFFNGVLTIWKKRTNIRRQPSYTTI